MKRMSIMALGLLAALAMGATLASSASAMTYLTLRTAGGALAVGSSLTATSSNLVLATGAGNVECSSTEMSGKLTLNGKVIDSGTLEGWSSNGEEEGGGCHSTTSFGPAAVEVLYAPFPITFKLSGKGTIKATGGDLTKFRLNLFFYNNIPSLQCTYEAEKIAYTLTPGGFGQPVALAPKVSEQKFKLHRPANASCSAVVKMSGNFAMSSGGETLETEMT